MGSQRDMGLSALVIGTGPHHRKQSTMIIISSSFQRYPVFWYLLPAQDKRNKRKTGTLLGIKNTNSVYWKRQCNIQGMLFSVEWIALNLHFKRDNNIPVQWLNDYMVRTESGLEEKTCVETMAVKLGQGKCYLTWHKVCLQQSSQEHYLFNC